MTSRALGSGRGQKVGWVGGAEGEQAGPATVTSRA